MVGRRLRLGLMSCGLLGTLLMFGRKVGVSRFSLRGSGDEKEKKKEVYLG